jgi:hypothetical protein
MQSRDLTTMWTPLGLVKMCTLPQGTTNSVAHMMNGMNEVLRDFILEKTMPFLDDIPIKGCIDEKNDETMDKKGWRKFFFRSYYKLWKDVVKIGRSAFNFIWIKSIFGIREIVSVEHMCGPCG